MRNRADNNQDEIVEKLRGIGCSVQVLSQVGNGFPDLLCGYRGVNYLLEVKGKRGVLSDYQLEWHMFWNGQVCIVRTFEDARRMIEDGTAIETIKEAIGE